MQSSSVAETVLVTGASSGFGRLTALALAQRGYRVCAGVRDPAGRNAVAAAALTEAARGLAGELRVVALDVTDEGSCERAVAQVLADGGALDVLINNAGVAAAGLVETFTPADAQRLFDVNVFGVLRMLRAALPGMRARRRGLVVYVSSTDGREVMPFLGLYDASKAALESLAEATSYELAPLGIDSVIVQPGTFPTTSILANLVPAGDPARAEGYGEVAALPAGLFAGLDAMVRSGEAPDPGLVAEAIVEAVARPHGHRPRRVVVDPSGADRTARANAVADAVQSELLAQFGLSHLRPAP